MTNLFKEFFESEKSGGLVLLCCTILSLAISNSLLGDAYIEFWHIHLAGLSIEQWINDGLMAIFFLLIGLELEREIYIGELSNFRESSLPIFAAIGGMIVPVAIYLIINMGENTLSGAGIPMATDIAFALGILSLMGNRIPISLKIFLTALAVIDDIGAIIMIAIFYTQSVVWNYLVLVFLIWGILFAFNKFKVRNLVVYLLGGVIMWYCMLRSGVHASITGIILAFVIPFDRGEEKSISYKLQHFLHLPVAFCILPLFALANTAFKFNLDISQVYTQRYSLGILLGLVLGKPLGIFLASFLTVKLNLTRLPKDMNFKMILGVGFLGGIGFTMSIFIALLAFNHVENINQSKFSILLASLISSLLGYYVLKNKAI